MTAAMSIAVGAAFVWLGMVLAISFIEAPLKFRAPGVTLPIGLGIGRLVFRALNAAEVVLAVVVVAALLVDRSSTVAATALGVAAATLLVQVLGVRPTLARRSDAVLSGRDAPRSRAHHVYVGLEILKVVALLTGGIALLAA